MAAAVASTSTNGAPSGSPGATAAGSASNLAALPPLPFVLDVSCPLPVGKAASASVTGWPWSIAGPSCHGETVVAYIARRYYETLYLGETLFPLSGLVADLERCGAVDGEAMRSTLARHTKSLSEVETRHRRVLGPIVTAALACGGTEATRARLEEAIRTADLADDERGAILTAVDMRAKSKAAVEGGQTVAPRRLIEELEHREIFIQIVLLLVYRTLPPSEPPKKRKKRKARPEDDLDASLELLADRVGVWQAVAELGIGAPESKAAPKEDDVRLFWDQVLRTSFLGRETAFCTSFHLKAFGQPMPPDLVPQKKPRKPAVTHKLETDDWEEALERRRREKLRKEREESVRKEKERGERGRMYRTTSRHSRSSSNDPPPTRVRAPSAQELFKQREFVRRPRPLARSASAAQSGPGLLGRHVESTASLGPGLARPTSTAFPQPQAQSLQPTRSETLIHATPAKRSHTIFSRAQPTPIQEEPSSAERSQGGSAHYVAETPRATRIAPYAVAETPLGLPFSVSETPRARLPLVAETPARAWTMVTPRKANPFIAETPQEDLGELMVPTDESESE